MPTIMQTTNIIWFSQHTLDVITNEIMPNVFSLKECVLGLVVDGTEESGAHEIRGLL